MKQIEEVEQSFSEPLTTPLLQCGRYRLDGELKVRGPLDNSSSKKLVNVHAVVVSQSLSVNVSWHIQVGVPV